MIRWQSIQHDVYNLEQLIWEDLHVPMAAMGNAPDPIIIKDDDEDVI